MRKKIQKFGFIKFKFIHIIKKKKKNFEIQYQPCNIYDLIARSEPDSRKQETLNYSQENANPKKRKKKKSSHHQNQKH